MTSALMDIADTLATDFRDAVKDAEKADMEAIEAIMHDFNIATTDFNAREQTLNTKAEQAVRTLTEIATLRDVNATTYNRRLEAIRDQIAVYKESKVPGEMKDIGNVVRLENKA